jgi:hypothetical protein
MKATWPARGEDEANSIVVVIRPNLGGNVVEQRRMLSIDPGDLVIELVVSHDWIDGRSRRLRRSFRSSC